MFGVPDKKKKNCLNQPASHLTGLVAKTRLREFYKNRKSTIFSAENYNTNLKLKNCNYLHIFTGGQEKSLGQYSNVQISVNTLDGYNFLTCIDRTI